MAEFAVNGTRLYYEVKGDPEGAQTVAFFNGVMASTASWALIYSVFERLGFRIILHDFRGQLLSDKPEGPYTFALHAADAKALFEHLGAEKVHLIGTSYGGEVAMRFAIDYPGMAASVTVIDSVSELDDVLESFVQSWKILCDTGSAEFLFRGLFPSVYGAEYLAKNKETLLERAKGMNLFPRDFLEGQKILYDAFLDDVTMTNELKNIRCPALILCGEEDILKPPKFSKIIADNIPNAEYMTIPGCGHVGIFEKPEELQSAVLGFITKHTSVK